MQNTNLKPKTNASIFIPHLGCPHQCSFCSKTEITEAEKSITANNVREILEGHIISLKRRGMVAEIAFFGGTFTAIDPLFRQKLLKTANEYLRMYPDIFSGIRCSTRPDYIDRGILDELKSENVTAIELGAQSMDDAVLSANNRGHTSDDVRNASQLIKSYGFELGLQMMTGLYKDTIQKCLYTGDEFIALSPDTVRIYPTEVFRGTKLYEIGHTPFPLDETIKLCGKLYGRFVERGIRVIRIGLNKKGNVIGERSISYYYYKRMVKAMEESTSKKFVVFTDKRNISKINGHKCENKLKLLEKGFTYKIKERQGEDLEINALQNTRTSGF